MDGKKSAPAGAELLKRREARWRKAVALETPDRVPIVVLANGFCARHLGVRLADFVSDWELALDTTIDSLTGLGELDGVTYPFLPPSIFPLVMLSAVMLPGRDLADDMPWQVHERERMEPADYDRIVEQGYDAWLQAFADQHFPDVLCEFERYESFYPKAASAWEEIGVLPLLGFAMPGFAVDQFSGGRSIKELLLDLHRIPDRVQAAADVVHESTMRGIRAAFDSGNVRCIEISAARVSSSILSPRLWERFVFPYLVEMAETAVSLGAVVSLHFDGDWGGDLHRLRELPKGKCVLELDGKTDIFKAKEVLGDHMCLQGDVPAALLALGNPDQVHDYCTRLISEIGPSGFILSPGCEIPINAKPENVAAMFASVQ